MNKQCKKCLWVNPDGCRLVVISNYDEWIKNQNVDHTETQHQHPGGNCTSFRKDGWFYRITGWYYTAKKYLLGRW